MEISWLGESALLLRGRETKVVLDPTSAENSHKLAQGAELLVSAAGRANDFEPARGPRVVSRPGEYELCGVAVRGIQTRQGTVFVAEVDEVAVCDLGSLQGLLEPDALEALGPLDVLAVSLEGGDAERVSQVAQLSAQLQPSILVPVGYRPGVEGEPGELERFAKEMGLAQVQPQAKLSVNGSGGAPDDTRVVVLEARA